MCIYCNLVLVVLVLALNSQVTAVIDGHSVLDSIHFKCQTAHAGKIIVVHKSAEHSRPYMVHVEGYDEEKGNFTCGGFLVSEDFVMTAAHCKAESYNVCFGMNSLDDNGMKCSSVKEHFSHKDYNEETLTNDIMLLKLSNRAAKEIIKPITMADKADNSPKMCVVLGWGITDNGKPSSKLMEVNVTLTDDEMCPEEKAFCSKGKKGPAARDSGGPLVCENGKAYGVISGHQENLTKYTKIPEYMDWIKEVMQP
ncbi:PREDICTED: granzyme B-like [Cyprinodon variegatus]|uniref:granzyme B-like n=1 Tax=Cyprinodon variegatus TaxID=28743 RepID=UPI000742622D|nr:PREDICTED: granzyme B-like [Cyprinodon variegatus]